MDETVGEKGHFMPGMNVHALAGDVTKAKYHPGNGQCCCTQLLLSGSGLFYEEPLELRGLENKRGVTLWPCHLH
jgi:hypothetical protein